MKGENSKLREALAHLGQDIDDIMHQQRETHWNGKADQAIGLLDDGMLSKEEEE